MIILRYDKRRGTGYVSPLDIFDDMGWWLGDPSTSWTIRGQWVDPDKYDITPKKEYQQTLIENKQKQIEQAEESLGRLKEELKELKKNS